MFVAREGLVTRGGAWCSWYASTSDGMFVAREGLVTRGGAWCSWYTSTSDGMFVARGGACNYGVPGIPLPAMVCLLLGEGLVTR